MNVSLTSGPSYASAGGVEIPVISSFFDTATADDGAHGVLSTGVTARYITNFGWVPAGIYDLVVQCTKGSVRSIAGTEDSSALTAAGWTVATTNSGTVTYNSSGKLVLGTSAGNTATSVVSLTSPTTDISDGGGLLFRMRFQASSHSGGAVGSCPYFCNGTTVTGSIEHNTVTIRSSSNPKSICLWLSGAASTGAQTGPDALPLGGEIAMIAWMSPARMLSGSTPSTPAAVYYVGDTGTPYMVRRFSDAITAATRTLQIGDLNPAASVTHSIRDLKAMFLT